ncbi:hypothetical protein [Caulobacter soli]|uniref:hypothetical protein n=1 Tax=Caulobacter soli TaxID=2708539 RepID=UPI001FE68390|nr:hypothetical protein [Caulobacter soli]
MQSSTHSSQMNTVGPAMSLRTSCWLFPQKEQYRVLLVSPLAAFVMVASHARAVQAEAETTDSFSAYSATEAAGYPPGVV